jgi:hypothetical protein
VGGQNFGNQLQTGLEVYLEVKMSTTKNVIIISILLLVVGVLIYFFTPFFPLQKMSVITNTPEDVKVCDYDTGVSCSVANDCWQVLKDQADADTYTQWQQSVTFKCNGKCIAGDTSC